MRINALANKGFPPYAPISDMHTKSRSYRRTAFVRRALPVLFCLLLFNQPKVRAAMVVLDFESLSDLESLTSQFAGVAFVNTIALTAGISLNEFEFPPTSGSVVISDNGGSITIDFASPVQSVSGFFTHLVPIELTAFDADNVQVDQVVSAFSSNLLLSGDPGSSPNEVLSVAFGGGISRVVIAGDELGGSLTLDDLTYETADEVPEPNSTFIFLNVVGALFVRRRAKQNQ